MSAFFASLIQWFKTSPAVEAARQEAVQELSDAAQQFVTLVEKHAPDMVDMVTHKITDALVMAIAGKLTRNG